jgi:hypothetical protein
VIFFGWGKKSLPLGELGDKPCGRCGLIRPFRAFVNYSYFRLYFIFGMVTTKKYVAACTICGQGVEIDKQEAQSAFPQNPIPIMQRWGLAIFGMGLITVVAALNFR